MEKFLLLFLFFSSSHDRVPFPNVKKVKIKEKKNPSHAPRGPAPNSLLYCSYDHAVMNVSMNVSVIL